MSKQNRTMCQKCLKAKHDECEGCECIHNRTSNRQGAGMTDEMGDIMQQKNALAELHSQLAACQRELAWLKQQENEARRVPILEQQLQRMKEALKHVFTVGHAGSDGCSECIAARELLK